MLVAVNEMSPGTNDPTVTGTTVNNMMAGEESFAQFCQTYGPHEKKEHTTTNVYNQNSEITTPDHLSTSSSAISSSEESGVSFWNHLCSSYWPVLLLWVKSSMFGTANMVRSLILGNFLLFVLHQFNPPEAVQQSAWWNTLCAALGATNAKADPQAWPPPALTALAILTVVALIIHPDGFTWIIWRNIRECLVEVMRTFIFCWNVMVHDYGIIPTLVASATFAALLFLAVIVHKALSPRKARDDNNNNAKNERKKKKRRNHHNNRVGGNRIRGGAPSRNSSTMTRAFEETTTSATTTTTTSTASNHPTPLLPAPTVPLLQERDSNLSSEHSVNSKHPQLLPRHRLPSASTIDTTTLTDDQSCESIQSSPLAHVTISSVSSIDPPATVDNNNSTTTTEESTPIVQNKQVSRWSQLESNADRDYVQNHRGRNGKKWSKDVRPNTTAGKSPSEPWDFNRPNRRSANVRRGSGGNHTQPPRNYNRTSRNTPPAAMSHDDAIHSPQRSLLPPRTLDHTRQHPYGTPSYSPSLLLGVEGSTGATPSLSQLSNPMNGNNMYPQWNSNAAMAPRPIIRPPPGLTRESAAMMDPLVSGRPVASFLTTTTSPRLLPRHDEGLFPSNNNSINNATFPDASLEASNPSFYPATQLVPSYHHTFTNHNSPPSHHVKENPFDDNDDEMESRIEAELQELGGQMAGSILDF